MISKESMRVKLTLLLRMMLNVQRTMEPGEYIMDIINTIMTQGAIEIHKSREDNVISTSDLGLHHAAHAMQDKFISISEQLFENSHSGLPITLTLGKEMLIIVSGIDELVDQLEKIYSTPPEDLPDLQKEEREFIDEGPSCRVCGCTEFRACPGGCFWIEPDLCSKCSV